MSMVRVVKGFTSESVTEWSNVAEETTEDKPESSDAPDEPSGTEVEGEGSPRSPEVSGAPAEMKMVVAGTVSVMVWTAEASSGCGPSEGVSGLVGRTVTKTVVATSWWQLGDALAAPSEMPSPDPREDSPPDCLHACQYCTCDRKDNASEHTRTQELGPMPN